MQIISTVNKSNEPGIIQHFKSTEPREQGRSKQLSRIRFNAQGHRQWTEVLNCDLVRHFKSTEPSEQGRSKQLSWTRFYAKGNQHRTEVLNTDVIRPYNKSNATQKVNNATAYLKQAHAKQEQARKLNRESIEARLARAEAWDEKTKSNKAEAHSDLPSRAKVTTGTGNSRGEWTWPALDSHWTHESTTCIGDQMTRHRFTLN
jgi:membrane protein involved in colicin uptake